MGNKPSNSLAHPYEPERCPILEAWPEFWWMEEMEKAALEEALAIKLGGEGLRPRRSSGRDRG
jgi:hypothetical protein